MSDASSQAQRDQWDEEDRQKIIRAGMPPVYLLNKAREDLKELTISIKELEDKLRTEKSDREELERWLMPFHKGK